MRSLNKLQIIGRVGANPELRYTPKGTAVAEFTVATNETFQPEGQEKQQRTQWHRIIAWRGAAENVAKLLKKGSPVYVEGKLVYRSYEDEHKKKHTVSEIILDEFNLLESKEDSTEAAPASAQTQAAQVPA